MTWFKVDDGLHAHRKVRAVRRSHASKPRDVAPLGLWVLAGSWCGGNPTGGFVPAEVLADWDDDWEVLVARLVAAGLWWETTQDGEQGYGFHDWQDYIPSPDGIEDASKSGSFGNHERWHVRRGMASPDCSFCAADRPDDRGDIGAIDRGDSGANRVRDRLPDPTRPDPTRPQTPIAHSPADRFEDFWRAYGKKVDRKKAETAYRNALKKPGVTAELLLTAASEYVAWQRAHNDGGKYIKHATTWLHGECWNDETPSAPASRSEQWLNLAQRLHEGEIA